MSSLYTLSAFLSPSATATSQPPASLSAQQIAALLAPVEGAIKAANNDAQATGVAMKHPQAACATAQGTDVAAAVKKLRG